VDGAPDPLVGLTVGGRYLIQAPLGQGGVARVYRALQEPMGREVAIKVVRPDLEGPQRAAFETRFLREAALAGRLQHSALVRIYDYGRDEDDGACYIAMELLRGPSLKRRMSGPMDPDLTARVGSELARGLYHAHSRGVVHRDVKPSNVLMVRDDQGQEHPKLIDFGLVLAEDDEDSVTGAGTFLGTPHYVAPEQAQAEDDLDGRADQYSLGVVLYRMLTGVLPFSAEHPMAIALMHVREPYPPMQSRAPKVEVDAVLESVVRRCMAKKPEDRWPDCAALAEALEDWREGLEPLLTDEERPPSPPPPPRSSGPMVALGVALGLASVGAAAGLWVSQGQPSPPPPPHPARVEAELAAPPPPQAQAEVAVRVETVQLPPAPKPRPKATPAPASAPSQAYDGVLMSPAEAAAALSWINGASEAELRAGGMYGRAVNIVLDKRPFASMQAFAATPYVGEKTVRVALTASGAQP
jgi:serine/threonine protein kinase